MPEHRRKQVRLKGYNYANEGAYFITLVTVNREYLFGEIVNGEMRLNRWGEILQEELGKTAVIRKEINIDTYQIMPNHLHAIVMILDIEMSGPGSGDPQSRAHGSAPLPEGHNLPQQRKPHSLGSFVAGLKSAVTTRINQDRNTPRMPVWQRNYFDRVIRDESEWEKILAYIETNPLNWDQDNENK